MKDLVDSRLNRIEWIDGDRVSGHELMDPFIQGIGIPFALGGSSGEWADRFEKVTIRQDANQTCILDHQ